MKTDLRQSPEAEAMWLGGKGIEFICAFRLMELKKKVLFMLC